jgi:zinc and cadmium transporter
MNGIGTLSLYTGAILAGALAGGALPLFGTARRSDVLLSFSAGVMLGAAFFHMLPEAVEASGVNAIPFVLAGFVLVYLLERFVLVHVCAEPGPQPVAEGAAADVHVHGAPGHVHVHGDATGCTVHTMGLAAFLGMSLHTIGDGFALAAASAEANLGLLVFLAILAHKIPNAFSLSAILRAEGYSRPRALLMNAAFALMVPLGALSFVVLRAVIRVDTFTSIALAGSAGTFLHLSLSDILPDVHRRGVAKWRLTIAVIAGLALMGALRFLRHGHAG